MNNPKKQPIGIFDSGIGGLTVYKEIRKNFPFEDIVYFGDTARVPYGPKSRSTIIDYSIQNTRFLMQFNAKIIVVACNTASAAAIPTLKKMFPVSIVDVINPGAFTAVQKTRNSRIGVTGTEGTIKSKAYEEAIKELQPAASIFSKSCPLFVSLVEEGWEDHEITELIVKEYLSEMIDNDIDTLVLGCTHYPILKHTIQKFMSNDVSLVDSAEAVASRLKDILPFPETETAGKDAFFVSDNEAKFKMIAERILGNDIKTLNKVKLGETWYLDSRNI